MKTTYQNVREYAERKGLESVQIDSIPEGFSFKEPDIEISGVLHIGRYTAFIPLKDWNEINQVWSFTIEGLQNIYNDYAVKRN